MSRSAEEIYREALALSEDEREKLLLLLTMQAGSGWASPEVEQSWMEEIERRERDYQAGKTELIPAEDVHRQLRERLSKSRGQ